MNLTRAFTTLGSLGWSSNSVSRKERKISTCSNVRGKPRKVEGNFLYLQAKRLNSIKRNSPQHMKASTKCRIDEQFFHLSQRGSEGKRQGKKARRNVHFQKCIFAEEEMKKNFPPFRVPLLALDIVIIAAIKSGGFLEQSFNLRQVVYMCAFLFLARDLTNSYIMNGLSLKSESPANERLKRDEHLGPVNLQPQSCSEDHIIKTRLLTSGLGLAWTKHSSSAGSPMPVCTHGVFTRTSGGSGKQTSLSSL